MRKAWKRLISGCLALTLVGTMALPGGAAGVEAAEDAAELLAVTVGEYTPRKGAVTGDVDAIQKGQRYTLIALPALVAMQGSAPKTLTATDLAAASGRALFIGSAVASGNGQVTFERVRLRTAEAAVYYVTGPGLDTPLMEATGLSTAMTGTVVTASAGQEAKVTLVDAETGYHYGNAQMADASTGVYYFDSIAPGTYDLEISKAGYLPTVRTAVVVTDGGTTTLRKLDISQQVGDVTNDGVRDITDLAALVRDYGKAGSLSAAGCTPDLDGNGVADDGDVALLIPFLTTGTAEDVSDAVITVSDADPATEMPVRSLCFQVDTQATVSAAAFSITYQTNTIQPLNEKGGLVAPVDGGTLANCLVAAQGYTACLTSWSVAGDRVTLNFCLTADTPQPGGEVMARFYYRPVSGSTSGLHPQAFTLDQGGALVGKDTVVTQTSLTYPNSDGYRVGEIVIDQQSAAGPEGVTLEVPTAGRTTVLRLTATGTTADGTVLTDLSGVTWRATYPGGEPTAGITVGSGHLTVTAQALGGTIHVTASRDGVTSEPLVVKLEKAEAYPAAIAILKNGEVCTQDTLSFDFNAVDEPYAQYTARIQDQYGALMGGQTAVWTLSGAPEGVSVSDAGRLSVNAELASSKTTPFTVRAQCGGAQTTLQVTLSVQLPIRELTLSGQDGKVIIPAAGEANATYKYFIKALDAKGVEVGEFTSSLTVSPADQNVTVSQEMDGTYLLVVASNAKEGEYTLTATAGKVTKDFQVTLSNAAQAAKQAVLLYNNRNVEGQTISVVAGQETILTFVPQLNGADGKPISAQPSSWDWTLASAAAGVALPAGVSLPAKGATGALKVADTVKAGKYSLELKATENTTNLKLSVRGTVTLNVTPVLTSLRLTGPETALTLPEGEDLTYTLAVDALDAHGQAMTLPADLQWSVVAKGSDTAPDGVEVSQEGVLTVTPAAAGGTVVVKVASADGTISDQVEVVLTPATTGPVLTLYHTVTLGDAVQPEARVSGGAHAIRLKEGTALNIQYAAKLVDRLTGQVEDVTDRVSWSNDCNSFQLNDSTESGAEPYTAKVTAEYNGQSATVDVQVTVYPDVVDIRPYFGAGVPSTPADVEPPYTLEIPASAAKTYTAKLVALIRRAGSVQAVALADLGQRYDLSVETPLTGVSATVDELGYNLLLTVAPTAAQNDMSDPGQGVADKRYIRFTYSYNPDETIQADPLAVRLRQEETKVSRVSLHCGVGTGSDFTFDAVQSPETATVPAGAYGNCYGMRLVDQYGAAVTNRQVVWTLETPSALKDDQGNDLVRLVNTGLTADKAYASYAGIRRILVSTEAPAGTYTLLLTAVAGEFTCTHTIALTVTAPVSAAGLTAQLTGPEEIVIPWYFSGVNSTDLNTEANTATYALSLRTADGAYELDASEYEPIWSVMDASGGAATGVTVAGHETNANLGVVSVTSGGDQRVTLTAAVTLDDGSQVIATCPVETKREASIPVLLYVISGNQTLIKDDFLLSAGQIGPVRHNYTYRLVDQYNQTYTGEAKVTWVLSGGAAVNATLTVVNATTAQVQVVNGQKAVNGKANLSASTPVTLPDGTGVEVKTVLPISVRSAGADGSGGGGGGGGGDTSASKKPTPTPTRTPSPSPSKTPSPSPSPSPSAVPPPVASGNSRVTLTPPITSTGTTGTAALTKEQEATLTSATGSGGTVVIAPTGGEGLNSISVSLTAATASTIAAQKNQTLQIQTPLGIVKLSPESVKALASRGGNNVTVTVSNVSGVTKVDLTCGSTAATLPGEIVLNIPTNGNIAIRVNGDGTETLLKKAVVENNRLRARLDGSAQIRLESRNPGFGDTVNHWARSAVTFTTARELFQGTSATTFSPDGTMTRSMLVTVLHRLEDEPASSGSIFADIPQNIWYTEAVRWANATGIVEGTDNGFKPNDPVTREQLATILYRYMVKQGLSTTGRDQLQSYPDRDSVSTWAQDELKWAVFVGLVKGKGNGMLDPQGNATRAEVSTVMERLIRLMAPTV